MNNFFLSILGLLLTASNAVAQLIPDTTLGNESTSISINELQKLIEGGATRGENLFHSFQEFNIGEGEKVYFNNPEGIQNIFSRITGNNLSQILGTLGVNSSANLFLLNPNGIIFGQNARLDLQGSFTVTTADSILFPNDLEFSAVDPKSPPLLIIDRPIGLVIGNRLSEIKIQNIGHQIDSPIFPVEKKSITYLGLSYSQTLNIASNIIKLEGGVISIPNGKINIIATSDSIINIDNNNLTIEDHSNLSDIYFTNSALVEVIENISGEINIIAKNISLDNNSIILNKDLEAMTNSVSINIFASESLRMNQVSPNIGNPTLIGSENFGSRTGSSININAKLIQINNYATIANSTFSDGNGGNINIESQNINLSSPQAISIFIQNPLYNITKIGTRTFSFGNAGNVNINSDRITMKNGTLIGSFTNISLLNIGRTGNVNIVAKDIFLDSKNLSFFNATAIANTSLGSFANSGDINIRTERLTLKNGSLISTPSGNLGNSGFISIEASDFIKISGISPNNNFLSSITSSIEKFDPDVLNSIEAINLVQGQAGNIIINTNRLILEDRGTISVINQGLGDSGNIEINANFIELNNGSINATTQSGKGGSIVINSQDIRSNNGTISTSSAVVGNGGKILIDTGTLLTLNDNAISANALEGDGGKIAISTNGLFLSPESRITANSTFGTQGIIEIEVLKDPVGSILETLNIQFNSSERIVADSCFNNRRRDQLKIVGNGGIPPTPINNKNSFLEEEISSSENGTSIAVGEELITTADGRLLLVAKTTPETAENLVCH